MAGLIIAAPSSGAGKTTITLGLLRALRRAGHDIRSAKSGPDYIDPQFHAAATGQPCYNLDAWAMSPERIKSLAAGTSDLIIEGAMGLFDGAPPDAKGSSADIAALLNLPVVLIVDARAMSHSVAAIVRGFATHRADVRVAGVILNNIGSVRHAGMLTAALKPLDIPVLGAVPYSDSLERPSRHLGLVQAGEMPDLEPFLNAAADSMACHINLEALCAVMAPVSLSVPIEHNPKGPRSIAVARDAAFSFIYPHQIANWDANDVEVQYFSPLANDPVPDAGHVFLPGGYPELYAAQLASNQIFMQSLKSAAQTSHIYGECGGYMALGETLIDADGTRHKMAGLLGLTTSFETRKRHLGYRRLQGIAGHILDDSAGLNQRYTAHEFHYATTVSADGTPLFQAETADDIPLGQIGLAEGRVAGSFAHIIDTGRFGPIANRPAQA